MPTYQQLSCSLPEYKENKHLYNYNLASEDWGDAAVSGIMHIED